jgi:hypothetical protein
MISGVAWFLPSESAQTAFMVAGTALSVAVVIPLMVRTWRQTSIQTQLASDTRRE